VKNLKRAISVVAAGGLMLGGLVALAPVAGATVTPVGGCGGLRALGTAKSTTPGKGITDADNRDVSIASKGVDPNVNKGTNLGACLFAGGLSTPDSSIPPVKGYSGGKSITKWSTKLFSPEADCNTADTTDLTEWPIAGALSIGFSDLNAQAKANSLSAEISVTGFTDPDNDPATPSDVVKFHGIVIKGVAAGADVAGETEFDPTIKDKTQLTNNPYFGYNYDLAGALGCTTPAIDDANILSFNNGDDGAGNSQLLALPVAGISFSIGTP
jgi:hypothetical protein